MNISERQEHKILRFLGDISFGLALMLYILILTFAGTLYQVKHAVSIGLENAIAHFFYTPFILIPVGGTESPLAIPIPGMGVACIILFINLAIGGVLRMRRSWHNIGVFIAHAGILMLLFGVIGGQWFTESIDEISLVPQKQYRHPKLPFTIELKHFTVDYYPDTQKPKSYESFVELINKNGVKDQIAIRMNEPLRREGWTLYQMSWIPAIIPHGKAISILRATHNPLEKVPEYASYIITLGLLWHFGYMMIQFLNRQKNKVNQDIQYPSEHTEQTNGNLKKRWYIVGIILLTLTLFIGLSFVLRTHKETPYIENHVKWTPVFLTEAQSMAILDGGRIKPISSYAAFRLLRVHGKKQFKIRTSEGDYTVSPTEWFLDCIFRPALAIKYPIFLINRDDVVAQLRLPQQSNKRKYYSLAQLIEQKDNLESIAQSAMILPEHELTPLQREILRLYRNVSSVYTWITLLPNALQNPNQLKPIGSPCIFPDSKTEPTAVPLTSVPAQELIMPLITASLQLNQATHEKHTQKTESLDKAQVLLHQTLIQPNVQATQTYCKTLKQERQYYELDPLYAALGSFILGFICLLINALCKPFVHSPKLKPIFATGGINGSWLCALVGSGILLYGLILRSMITMRSPVTNTYETIAFIACVGVLCALVVELFHKKGIILATGLILGIIAAQTGILYESSQASDHMDPLVAVLRSNFLLSTHVITIVLGYASGLLLAILAHIRLIAAPLQWIQIQTVHALDRAAYGMLCFSLVFTLVGTVFGGIWGNEAWGRFWGWDPKENGALMIVLWQLCVLHARHLSWFSPYLLHLCNMIGGVIIAFAWWGVNLMGVGLHSYGFGTGQDILTGFYIIEGVLCVVFIALHQYRKRLYGLEH